MEQSVIDKLYEDLKVDIKPGGQGFKYVKTRYVIDRLNKAFENEWGTEVRSMELIGDEVLVRVALTAWAKGSDRPLTQEGYGSAKKFGNSEIGNIAKSALSKAIKNAARNWGVGLFLEEEDDYSGSTSNDMPKSMPNVGMNTPSMPGMPSMPNMPSTPPSGGGMPQNTPPQQQATPQFTEPTMSTPPMANSMPSGNMPSNTPPASNGLPQMGAMPQTGAMPSNTPPSMPSMPQQASNTPPPPETNTGGVEGQKITAVQKVAIDSRLQEKGMNFNQAATTYFGEKGMAVPSSVDEMSYGDAIGFVAMLSSK